MGAARAARARVERDQVTNRIQRPPVIARQAGDPAALTGPGQEPSRLTEPDTLAGTLLAASPDAIVVLDADRRIMEFSPAAEALTGYRRDDVLGKEAAGLLVPHRERARFAARLRATLAAGASGESPGPIRVTVARPDGTGRVAELTPLRVTVGSRPAVLAMLRDRTEADRSRADLAAQTERLNRLIASAIPAVLINDEDGLVTHASRSFGTLFAIADPGRLAGMPVAALARRIMTVFADPGGFLQRASAVLSARKPLSSEQVALADGGAIEAEYWPILAEGSYRGDLWLIRDVSEREALERRREQFLAIVSHELRTPLTSIVSFSELIRGEADGLTPDGSHFLDIIERNADRLLRLVGDLLMLHRLEGGSLPLDLAPVSIPSIAAEAVRTASPGAAKQGIGIHLDTGEGPPVRGDSRRLLQVLDNLIGNAVKFSRRDGLVRVAASCDGRSWRIGVSDAGIGIPEGETARLFGRFVRGSNARIAGLPGTGLGLSVVRLIIEMHGGRVEVDSVLDRGSTFSVFLPVDLASGTDK